MKRDLTFLAKEPACPINPCRIPEDELIQWVGHEVRSHFVKRAWLEEIVRVEPSKDLPARSAEALDQRVGLTLIGANLRIGESRQEAFDNCDRSVCRAAIDDDVLEIGVSLRVNTFERRLKELALIQRGRDNAYPGSTHVGFRQRGGSSQFRLGLSMGPAARRPSPGIGRSTTAT